MAANMNVILARDVMNLGHLGDVVRVKPGYARNFLFPKSLALPVSSTHVKLFEHQKRLIDHRKAKLRIQSEEFGKRLADIQITIPAKAGEQGKLFGSIGSRDIEKALSEHGHRLSHRDIKLEHPLKSIGLHTVDVRLEGDVKAKVNVVIIPEAVPEVVLAPATTEVAAKNQDPTSSAE